MTRLPNQNLLEQFDPEFRTATVLAQAAAKRVGSKEINQHHLIIGLLAEPAGLASKLLATLDADLDTLSRELREKLGPINPGSDRPWLSRNAGEAIREARHLTSTPDELTNTAHLLIALTKPFSGWGKAALKRAGVTRRAAKAAYEGGGLSTHPGLEAASVEWVWDFLPQSGRLIMAGDEAQKVGDLRRAIDLYREALATAKEDEIGPGALSDIYPRLIQAHLLIGDLEDAIDWLDEAEQYVEDYESQPLPKLSKRLDLLSGIEEAIGAHVQDLRLQFLRDRAQIYMGQDEFGLAEATARKLIETADELDHPTGLAAGRNLLGLAQAFKGDDDNEAERNLQASLEPAELIEPVDIANRAHSLATAAMLRGDPGEAMELAAQAEALYNELGFQRSVTVTRLTRGEALVVAGQAIPSGLLEEAEQMDPDGKAQLLGWAWRIDAASKRSSDASEALSAIERAISLSRRNNHKLMLVQSLIEHGRILVEMDDVHGARSSFEEALRLGEALNVRFSDEAHHELKGLGGDLP